MPTTSWSDAEDEALLGLSLLARVIYLQGLRRWMDYSTGIVGGPARRISRQMLAEIAFVEPVPGRHRNAAGAPSVKQIRNALDELARAGLIRRVGDAKSLIFELPLADVDKSAQKRMGRGRAEEGPTMMGHENPSNDAASGCMMGRGRADPDDGRMGPHPVSGSTTPSLPPEGPPSLPRGDPGPIPHRFPMDSTWTPDPHAVEARLRMMGVPARAMTEREELEVLGEFRSYWMDRTTERTEGQWLHAYAKAVKRHVTRRQKDEAGKRSGKTSGERFMSGLRSIAREIG